MGARTKRRAKFDFHGRSFVWWVDGDRWLRIASHDKQFVVAFPLGPSDEVPTNLVVNGPEFLGLQTRQRPVYLVIPEPHGPMGAWVDHILQWSFDPTHELVQTDAPPRLL